MIFHFISIILSLIVHEMTKSMVIMACVLSCMFDKYEEKWWEEETNLMFPA